jgi:flavin-dependent dehydrogenase
MAGIFAQRISKSSNHSEMVLNDGARVGIVGGGPAGSFFSYFFLDMAQRVGLDATVDIYEARDFSAIGPAGCNSCAGIISESLVQALATEGVNLPSTVVKRGITRYILHMDVGDVAIETPLNEMRIAAVHRGAGPRGIKEIKFRGFDGFLLELATEKGANILRGRVDEINWDNNRPQIKLRTGEYQTYDLLVIAAGVNTAALKLVEGLDFGYRPPETTRTYICELFLGQEMLQKHLGHSIHLFLLDIPRLEFAMLIPKDDFVTLCMLGRDIDDKMIETVLNSPQVRQCLPPNWQIPEGFCHCSPRTSIEDAIRPFTDRLVVVGDSGVTRLYKDGIGAAYRAAKAAAVTAVFDGVSAEDFRRHYLPFCKTTTRDNKYGKVIFAVTDQIRKWQFLRRGVLRTIIQEQKKEGGNRLLSMVFWDTFTGSAPYREVFLRTLNPSFLLRFLSNIVISLWPFSSRR